MCKILTMLYTISTHAPHTGGDHHTSTKCPPPVQFQPTPPTRGATTVAAVAATAKTISTHAPHTGGDLGKSLLGSCWKYFNPRPPHGGRLVDVVSTSLIHGHFNPRPPHGGRLHPFDNIVSTFEFQPTPPTRGATRLRVAQSSWAIVFQPTPPTRGATTIARGQTPGGNISTHAPHTGGDSGQTLQIHQQRNFNPRPPHGGRHHVGVVSRQLVRFQPTPPTRGATFIFFICF